MQTIHNVGFGTFNSFVDHEAMGAACREAVRAGYRLFDLASLHENQAEVGAALRAAIKDREVLRSDLCVCSKLWMADAAPGDVLEACERTLSETGLDYLDCFLVHWPAQWTKESKLVSPELGGQFAFEPVHTGRDLDALLATWRAMEALVDKGLVRSLGVSNFNLKQLTHLIEHARIKPALNEIELHPYLSQPTLVRFCEDQDIHIVAHSPLGKPGYKKAVDPCLLKDPVIVGLAAWLDKTPAQVALRWAVQKGWTPIPKSLTPQRIAANFDVVSWRLPKKAMEVIDSLNRGHRYTKPAWYPFDETEYPKDIELPKTQPEVIRGTVDPATGEYRNKFYRPGKVLHSDITIKPGILRNLATRAKDLLPASCLDAPNFLVTDDVCDRAFGGKVLAGLKAAGLQVEKVVIPSDEIDEAGVSGTEKYKTTAVLSRCYDEILGKGINKHSCIISMGGGVVNNICGMIAGTLYRGIGLVHITTTTMGMADAAIDFKQAVNHTLGKNLIGCYYPASNIIIDTEVLAHLAPRHILNGVAEALKHGLAQSAELTELIVKPFRERGVAAACADADVLSSIVKACIEYKVPTLIYYTSSDLNEMAPQYGHAVGHAVEYTSYHDGVTAPLLHGEAVSIGMCVSADIALVMGLCDEGCVRATYEACETVGLPVHVPATMDLEAVKAKMMYDKHFVKKPTMGLPTKLGKLHTLPTAEGPSFMIEVDADVIDAALMRNAARRDRQRLLGEKDLQAAALPSRPANLKSWTEDAFKAEEARPLTERLESKESGSLERPTVSTNAFGLKDGRDEPFSPILRRGYSSTTNLASEASEQPAAISVNGVELESAFFLKFIKSSEDLQAINDFRSGYMKFRQGEHKGADGEITDLSGGLSDEPTARPLPTLLCMCCN